MTIKKPSALLQSTKSIEKSRKGSTRRLLETPRFGAGLNSIGQWSKDNRIYMPFNDHLFHILGTYTKLQSFTAAQHYSVPFSTIQHHSALSSTIRHYSALFGISKHYSALFSTIQNNKALFSTIQHYSALFSTIQHYSALFITIQHNKALFSTIQHN